MLARVGCAAAYTLFWLLSLPPTWHYWYQVQASPEAFGDIAVARFFRVDLRGAAWRAAIYDRLPRLAVPVALAYGERDVLVPPHQVGSRTMAHTVS